MSTSNLYTILSGITKCISGLNARITAGESGSAPNLSAGYADNADSANTALSAGQVNNALTFNGTSGGNTVFNGSTAKTVKPGTGMSFTTSGNELTVDGVIATTTSYGLVKGDSSVLSGITQAKINSWDNAAGQSTGEMNQNAFSNVKVGSTTIAANTSTDTLTLSAGTNITLTPDATNDKVTISFNGTIPAAANNGILKYQLADGTASQIFSADQSTTSTLVIPAATSSAYGLVKGDSSVLSGITQAKINSWDTAAGQSTGEMNQNAFSNISLENIGTGLVSGDSSIAADSTSDSFALVAGNNILLSGSSANDKIVVKADSGSYYGTCSTLSATTEKVATISGDFFGLKVGDIFSIKFNNIAATNSTLNINGTGAYSIKRNGSGTVNSATSGTAGWKANDTVTFVFDGTYYEILSVSSNFYVSTKVNVVKNQTAKGYLLATTAEPGTSSVPKASTAIADTAVYLDTAAGELAATRFKGDLSGTINTATTGITQAANDNSTKIATTQYVDRAVSNAATTDTYPLISSYVQNTDGVDKIAPTNQQLNSLINNLETTIANIYTMIANN